MKMTTPDWVPDSCTLPTGERPLRLAEFDAFFAAYASRAVLRAPEHLSVTIPARAVPAARDLAKRESSCCSFFAFTVTSRSGSADAEMSIAVPAERIDILAALHRRISCPTSAADS